MHPVLPKLDTCAQGGFSVCVVEGSIVHHLGCGLNINTAL